MLYPGARHIANDEFPVDLMDIKMKNICFSHDGGSGTPIISNVNITIKQGTLVGILPAVGSASCQRAPISSRADPVLIL